MKRMLKIRQDQIDVLSDQALARYVHKLVLKIEADYAEGFAKGKERSQLNIWVTGQVKDARERGFHSVGEIKRFVHVAVLMGSDFTEQQWAQEILAQDIFASTKAALLEEYAENKKQEMLDKAQQLAKQKRKLLRTQFCMGKVGKLIAMGPATLGQTFTEEQAFSWLLKMSTTAFMAGCAEMIELEIWLDLSLSHGPDFHLKPEFNNAAFSKLSIAEKLNAYASSLEH